ncbi:MAG: spore protease YyaC [Eubacteriales bacterium]|nr:spore protease YyaC [Eubacteriales bacterium]
MKYGIDSNSEFAILEFKNSLYSILKNFEYKKIIFLCIGTDKVTGDCLGPLVGYKLSRLPLPNNVTILGNLDNPVHANNLRENIKWIYENEKDSLIVAIDASLGREEYINFITIGEGGIRPGAGVKKNLPYVGDLYIAGVVNKIGAISTLQSTRLSVVMKMADIISSGIWHCLNLLS